MQLTLLDEKIKKLEKLKKVLSDPDVQEVLADPELVALIQSLSSLKGSASTAVIASSGVRDTVPPPPGSLLGEVYRATRSLDRPFQAKDIVDVLKNGLNYSFEASDPQIAINGALRDLFQKGWITLKQQGVGRRPTLYENRL